MTEELEEVEAWKLHKDEEAEEMAKCEEYGGQVDLEIAAKVRQGMAQGLAQGVADEGMSQGIDSVGAAL